MAHRSPVNPSSESSRLARRLGLFDAVVIGLGSMIGAGVFAAISPAARAAGSGLLLGLMIAAFVAYCNATSSAQLATLYPESGGAYIYGWRRLGPFWGFLAGWCFVIGKLASCAAMAMTFANYAAPAAANPLAAGAVLALTAVNYMGIEKTARLTQAIVTVVLLILFLVVGAMLFGGTATFSRLSIETDTGIAGVLQSAGLLFFAFAGYARIATLGEEVIDPATTIPKAITRALGIALAVYAAVAVSALLAIGALSLAASSAPLADAMEAGRFAFMSPLVRVGAGVASLGALLSLIAAVSRTVFAMAANRDLPRVFAAVHPRYRAPHHAEIAVGLVVATVAAFTNVQSAIGFSSFAVLLYYAIANASALTLTNKERRRGRGLAWAGLIGCVAVAFSLPLPAVFGGAAVLLAGCAVFAATRGNRQDQARQS
jgi:APA family basic amino acid/polyamine antiporter